MVKGVAGETQTYIAAELSGYLETAPRTGPKGSGNRDGFHQARPEVFGLRLRVRPQLGRAIVLGMPPAEDQCVAG